MWRSSRAVVTDGDPPSSDARVQAVLEVLGGCPQAHVARSWGVETTLLSRWVADFVAAGTAQVTNRPVPQVAAQRDRFLAAFGHELRSPLAVAQGWVLMLLDGDVDEESTAESVRRLNAALDTLHERTLDIELLAAASLGRLRLHRRPTEVREVVQDLPGLDPTRLSGGATVVDVDPLLLGRAVRDVWSAAQMEPRPPATCVEVVTLESWVEIRVVRRGAPIETRVLQALFEPFDLNDDDTGVTMGLYLARALAVLHGGAIGVEQDHDTVLWIRVPRHPVPGAAPGAAPRRPQGGTR